MSETLEIHIFGGKKGESIAVRLPGNHWGVVDNYTPKTDDPSSNPTLRFLEKQGVTKLRFVCLTHPHADHYRGMRHLLTKFNPQSVWIFGAMTHRYLHAKVAQVLKHKAASSHLPSDEAENAD